MQNNPLSFNIPTINIGQPSLGAQLTLPVFNPQVKLTLQDQVQQPMIQIGNINSLTSISPINSLQLSEINMVSQQQTSKPSYDYQLNLDGLEDLEEDQLELDMKPIKSQTNKQNSNEETNSSSGPMSAVGLKHSKSLMPKFGQSASDRLELPQETSQRFQELELEVKFLRSLNNEMREEVQLLRQFIKINYKSPELLGQITDKKTKVALDKCFLDKPLVVLAFASPLARIRQTDQTKEFLEMDLLDFQKEFQCAISGLKKTGNQILVKKVHGTFERFQHVLTDNPIGLHFSGHGIRNTFSNLGKENYFISREGNCLVFETNDGLAHYVSQDKLKQIVSVSSLQFVFIASCYSQFAGEIFSNAGVEHVICVQHNQQLLDEAAVIFSQNFYELLFKETLTVCQAFSEAKRMLESNPDKGIREEAMKLLIFKKKQDNNVHKCKILGPFPTGEVETFNKKQHFPFEIAKVEEFVGRQIEMQQVIQCILQNRLTTLKGIPGIGKTTISKSIGCFFSEREIFEDGIIYISMRGKDQTSQLVQQMYLYFTNRIENQIQRRDVDQAYMETCIFKNLDERKVLLIIDNLEDALRKDKETVREFLKQMFERNPCLKILSTSRELIQDIGEITEKVHELKHLSNNYTIRLLEKKALREFQYDEIKELLELKLSRNLKNAIATPMANKKIEKLEDHHLCDLLAGHPMTVQLWAPLLQNSTLSQLYQKMLRMMQSKNFIQDSHDLQPVNSLKVSMDASIQYVKTQEPLAIDLFCLLGMFPGGATESDLNVLWQNKSKDWIFLAELLKKYSLLVDKISESELTLQKVKYQLLGPFMNKYAESLLNTFELRNFQKIIVEFFIKIFKQIYTDICVESKRSNDQEQNKIRLLNQEYETNIWACIYRICVVEINDKSKLKHAHRHHLAGDSSADEFESILIGEMTTDNEDIDMDFNVTKGFKFRSVIDSKTENEQQPQLPISSGESRQIIQQLFNKQQRTSEQRSQEQLSQELDQINQNLNTSQRKMQEFEDKIEQIQLADADPQVMMQIESEIVKAEQYQISLEQQRMDTEFAIEKLSVVSKTENNSNSQSITISQKSSSDSSESSSGSSQSSSYSSSSDTSRSEKDGSQIQQNISKLEQIKSRKQNEHSIIEDSFLEDYQGDTQMDLQFKIPLLKKQSSTIRLKKDVDPIDHPKNDEGVSSGYPNQTAYDNESQTTTKFPTVIQNQLEKLTTNPLKLRQQLGLPHKQIQTKLEPIQEQVISLTREGLLLVYFVSVKILNKQLPDASRAVNLMFNSSLSDLLCKANLQKLQGLILFLEKKYQLSLQCFEQAQKLFQNKSARNVGVALCLAAQGNILFNKASSFASDETKQFAKAQTMLETALQIYKENQHIAGQAFCCKQLGALKQKQQLPIKVYKQLFDDSLKFRKQLIKLVQNGKWIERYDGEDVSLLIEIIGDQPIVSQTLKSNRNNTRFGSQTRKQRQQINQTPQKQTLDESYLSQDEYELESINQIAKSPTQLKFRKPQKAMQLKSSDSKSQQELVFGNVQKRIEMHENKKKQSTIEQSQIKQPLAVPDNVCQLDYSWAFKIERTDPFFQKRQVKELPWYFYDFDLNWQIEQFYQQLQQSQSKTEKLSFQSGNKKYFIFQDQKKKKILVDEVNTSMLQQNQQTKVVRQICRFDRTCVNKPKLNKMQQSNLTKKIQEATANDQSKLTLMQDYLNSLQITTASQKQNWTGYYMHGGAKKQFNLSNVEILQNALYGTGFDSIGNYLVEGNIFPNRSVIFKKQYTSCVQVYEGEFNESFTKLTGLWHDDNDVIATEPFEIQLQVLIEYLSLQQLNDLALVLDLQEEVEDKIADQERTKAKRTIAAKVVRPAQQLGSKEIVPSKPLISARRNTMFANVQSSVKNQIGNAESTQKKQKKL